MFSILMLTHNRIHDVTRCLESLASTVARPDVELWVLDNGSDDGTLAYLRNLATTGYPFNLISSPDNLGVSGGRACLLDLAAGRPRNIILPQECADPKSEYVPSGDILCFLDSDVTVANDTWVDVLTMALRPENVGIVGPGGSFVRPGWAGFRAGYPGEVDVIAGFCQAFKREVVRAGAALDTGYGQFWHEDSDFCLQVRSLGWDVMCVPAPVRHSPGHSGDTVGAHDENLKRFADRWRGYGLVKIEGGY